MPLGASISREGIQGLLRKYGVPVVEGKIARSEKQALADANGIGYPVVLKIVSSEITHKTDCGCVKTNIMNGRELSAAYGHIMANAKGAKVEGMLVQKMVKEGIELIIGGRNDPQFGPLVVFGLGGIFVEILKDVSIRVCPITPTDAEEMIDEIKGSPLLHGARGTAHLDTKKLARLLVSVSKMLHEHEEIRELDLNPIIATSKGYYAVDVRVVS